jgi:hypothetical protein
MITHIDEYIHIGLRAIDEAHTRSDRQLPNLAVVLVVVRLLVLAVVGLVAGGE